MAASAYPKKAVPLRAHLDKKEPPVEIRSACGTFEAVPTHDYNTKNLQRRIATCRHRFLDITAAL